MRLPGKPDAPCFLGRGHVDHLPARASKFVKMAIAD